MLTKLQVVCVCVYLLRCSETRCCVERNDKVFDSHRGKMKQLTANFFTPGGRKTVQPFDIVLVLVDGLNKWVQSISWQKRHLNHTLKNNLLFVSWLQMVLSPDSLPMRLIRQLEDGALSRQPRTACECCYSFNDNRLGNGAWRFATELKWRQLI